jgi:uncharacterized protein YndB with AHSA1/START domain
MNKLLMLTAVFAALNCGMSPAAVPPVTEVFINAPVAEVWRLFTTSEGFKATGAAQAEVDLRVGGAIRSRADTKGKLGDPDTTIDEILAFDPEHMLALRPQHMPTGFPGQTALAEVWTVIYFTKSGEDMTHVKIVGLGYTDTEASQALRAVVEKSNRAMLDRLARPYAPQCARCKREAEAATP